MVEQTIQVTPPENVVEGQQPPVGVNTEVVEPKVTKTYTEEEHQAEINRIAGNTRQEERDKARRDFEEEKNRLYQSIQPQRPVQQQPSFFMQQAGQIAERRIRDAKARAQQTGEIIDEVAIREAVLANAELLDMNIGNVVDTHVRVSHATRNMIDGIISKLEKDPNIGDKIKLYKNDIENQVLSNIPPQMLNEQSVRGMASYVVGMKVMNGEMQFTTKLPPKSVPDVPSSAPSQRAKTSLSEEEKKAKEEFGLSDDEIKGEIKRTYGKKTSSS